MDNLSINDLHDRAHAYHRVVYSSETTLPFYASKRFLGSSSIHKHSEVYLQHYADEIETIPIETVVLDHHLHELESIDFLKMDVEGSEYHAFSGMDQMLRQGKVKTVVFEVNRAMLHDDWDAFVMLLRSYRYQYGKQFYVLTQDGSTVEMDLEIILSSGECPYLVMS